MGRKGIPTAGKVDVSPRIKGEGSRTRRRRSRSLEGVDGSDGEEDEGEGLKASRSFYELVGLGDEGGDPGVERSLNLAEVPSNLSHRHSNTVNAVMTALSCHTPWFDEAWQAQPEEARTELNSVIARLLARMDMVRSKTQMEPCFRYRGDITFVNMQHVSKLAEDDGKVEKIVLKCLQSSQIMLTRLGQVYTFPGNPSRQKRHMARTGLDTSVVDNTAKALKQNILNMVRIMVKNVLFEELMHSSVESVISKVCERSMLHSYQVKFLG